MIYDYIINANKNPHPAQQKQMGKTGICSPGNMPYFHGVDIIRIRIDFCAKKVYLIDAGQLYVLPDLMI